MRIALICPGETGCDDNPGCAIITAGIRWLLSQAFPDAVIVRVEMMRDVEGHWRAAATCDAAILCGNPRITLSEDAWWEDGILDRLVTLQAAGAKVVDGWAGSCIGSVDTIEGAAEQLLNHPRNRRNVERLAKLSGVIARDPLMQAVCERSGVNSVLLPCSSWWAARHYGVRAAAEKTTDIVVLGPNMPLDGFVVESGFKIIAPTLGDYDAAIRAGVEAELVSDPHSLLVVLSRARRVLSGRIHCAIPAASLGASVCVASIDSRALTCAPFGIGVIRAGELRQTSGPIFAPAAVPVLSESVAALRKMMA